MVTFTSVSETVVFRFFVSTVTAGWLDVSPCIVKEVFFWMIHSILSFDQITILPNNKIVLSCSAKVAIITITGPL